MPMPQIRFAVALAALCAALTARANLAVNPGFETGDFTGWTADSPDGETFVYEDDGLTTYAHSGNHLAAFADYDAPGSISQAIATTAGQTYTVSFYLRSFDDSTDPADFFEASFGGGSLLLGDQSADYALHSFTGIASGSTTLLTFQGMNEPVSFLLDDVSVEPQAVPEPASLATLGLGVFALARRRASHLRASRR